jgi:xylulokinase
MALRWFRDTFGQAEQSVANENGLDAYDLLGQIGEQSQAGCDGLVFLPHLSGAASPEFDTAARGVFYGISLQHGRAHFIRAIMESIAYMLKKNLAVVEQISGPVVEIRAMGGGSRSKLWLGIKSDILQKIVVPVGASESACLGVALLAGVASGVFLNLEEGLKRMVKPGKPLHPNPVHKEIYQIGYQEYLDLYESLSPMFKRSQQRHNLVRQLEQA